MRTTLGTAGAGDDVRAAIHRLGPSFERDYITHTTISHWADIMGEMVARRVRAVAIKDGKTLCREASQRRTGRGNEEALPLKTTGEVTRTTHAVAALEQRFCQRNHLLLLLKLGHANIPCASAKKSSVPKLPDFSAR